MGTGLPGQDRDLKRPLLALFAATALLLTGACGEDNASGDSNPDSQTDQTPGDDEDGEGGEDDD